MAVTYKDINDYTQKSSVAGTEKLPVSDTEYISPAQIADLNGVRVETGDIGIDLDFSDEDGYILAAFYSGHIKTKYFDSEAAETTTNKVTSISSQSTDMEYPSAKCVYDAISSGGGGSTTDCVHKTGDETIAGDKTFTDDIVVGDASNIVYGASAGSGFTKAITIDDKGDNVQTFVFSGLEGEPKAFIMTYGGSDYGVLCVVGDSTGYHGVYSAASTRQHNYTSDFTVSYSNGSLSVTAPSGTIFADGAYSLVYYYGSGTLTFRTSQVAPGSGVTSVTFTGTGMTETPAMYACMLETQVNNESYRRVALYTNCFYGYDGNDDLVQEPLGLSFFSSSVSDTTSSFTVSYSNGLVINSGGTNAGGYFHNPGTYTLYYLTSADIGGGSATYQSLSAELSAITTDISALETGKQDTLVSGTSIKTINSTSLLGSGNIAISSLPTVTATNNGQLLEVSNGAWAKGRKITISSSEPTAATGNNGDIWIVI